MAKIFITGSADGLGLMASQSLLSQGHEVVLHARNESRKKDLEKAINSTAQILVADLSDMMQTKQLAHQVNELGSLDAVIHNAGVYSATAKDVFAINVLAPYVLTCLTKKPKRLIYVSSDMHLGGHAKLDAIKNNINSITYSDSKLQVLMLCKAYSRKWKDVYCNALHPGWVPTKMGGKGAPDDLQKGYETQVWLASSNESEAMVSGNYFFHKKQSRYNPEADDIKLQEQLIGICKELTGIDLPA